MRFITLQEGNLPFKPIRKLQELRYILLAGTLMSAVVVPQLSVALDGARGADGRFIVAQREDPKDKGKQQNKGQPGGQQGGQGQPQGQPKQGSQPFTKGPPNQPGNQGATGQQQGGPGQQGGQGQQGLPGQQKQFGR